MKITLILVICLFIAGFAFGFEANKINIGGTISFGLKENVSSIIILPKASYFFRSNICLSVSFGYEISWQDHPYPSNPKNYYFGVGSWYFLKNFYGGLGFLYHVLNNNSMNAKSKDMNLELGVGYLIRFTRNLYIDIGITYIKGIGNVKAQAIAYEKNFGKSQIITKNETSEFRSMVGISLFFN